MLTYDYTKDLLNLQGVEVIKIEKSESKTLIYTQLPAKPHNCPCCSHQTTSVHDYRIRKIKDISAFGKYVILMHNHRRYVCKHCGKRFAEDNSFAPKYYRVTLLKESERKYKRSTEKKTVCFSNIQKEF